MGIDVWTTLIFQNFISLLIMLMIFFPVTNPTNRTVIPLEDLTFCGLFKVYIVKVFDAQLFFNCSNIKLQKQASIIFTICFYLCLTVSAELMPWRERPSSSVKHIFSETIKHINAKFSGKVAIRHISRPFFSKFWIFEF